MSKELSSEKRHNIMTLTDIVDMISAESLI